MLQTFAIMAGGALGVAGRFFLSTWIATRFGEHYPTGTMVVNILGCFIIGLFAGLTGPQGIFLPHPLTTQVVMIGVLGGFTTFSSFSLQTLVLLQEGQWAWAGINVFGTVFLCLVATWLGLQIASWMSLR